MTPVVLASGSATRAKLLTGAGVSFTAVSPGVDEAPVKAALLAEGAAPRDMADALAELKAEKVAARRPGLVIGADSTVELEGALIDKAETLDAARAVLTALSGRTHRLHSAVVVARDGAAIWREVKTATLHVRPLSPAFLDAYLEAEGEAALSCVGGYRIEGPGVQLFTRVEGDLFTVMGLPLFGLLDCLRRHGALAA